MSSSLSNLTECRDRWINLIMNLASKELPKIMPCFVQETIENFHYSLQCECRYLYKMCYYSQKGRYLHDEWIRAPNYDSKEALRMMMYQQYLEWNEKHFRSCQGPSSSQLMELRDVWAKELIEFSKTTLSITPPSHLQNILDDFPFELSLECITLYELCFYCQQGTYWHDKWDRFPNFPAKEELQKIMYHQYLERKRQNLLVP